MDFAGNDRRVTARVLARGPRLSGDGATRRAVLVRLVESRAAGAATVCYAVATATTRATRPDAMVDLIGFGACHRSFAWRAFADRVLDLAQELEAETDGQGAVTRDGLGSPSRRAGHPGDRGEDRS